MFSHDDKPGAFQPRPSSWGSAQTLRAAIYAAENRNAAATRQKGLAHPAQPGTDAFYRLGRRVLFVPAELRAFRERLRGGPKPDGHQSVGRVGI
jgi:hypothetical protein